MGLSMLLMRCWCVEAYLLIGLIRQRWGSLWNCSIIDVWHRPRKFLRWAFALAIRRISSLTGRSIPTAISTLIERFWRVHSLRFELNSKSKLLCFFLIVHEKNIRSKNSTARPSTDKRLNKEDTLAFIGSTGKFCMVGTGWSLLIVLYRMNHQFRCVFQTSESNPREKLGYHSVREGSAGRGHWWQWERPH